MRRGFAVLGDPPEERGALLHIGELGGGLQPTLGRRGMPQEPQELRPGQLGREGPFHGLIVAELRQTRSMAIEFSILGRGRAGRALAAAWGDRVRLLPHDAQPEGWVLLAVPDSAIEELGAAFPNRCLHMSGCLDIPGIPCAHPLTSFDGEAGDWQGTPLALTGELPPFVLDAFGELGFVAFELPPALKPLYHACAVLSSGHAATLWVGASRMLAEAGIELPGRGLLPLMESTLRNLALKGAEARTGPFIRGDEKTIAQDAEALPPEWRKLFLDLGRLR